MYQVNQLREILTAIKSRNLRDLIKKKIDTPSTENSPIKPYPIAKSMSCSATSLVKMPISQVAVNNNTAIVHQHQTLPVVYANTTAPQWLQPMNTCYTTVTHVMDFFFLLLFYFFFCSQLRVVAIMAVRLISFLQLFLFFYKLRKRLLVELCD